MKSERCMCINFRTVLLFLIFDSVKKSLGVRSGAIWRMTWWLDILLFQKFNCLYYFSSCLLLRATKNYGCMTWFWYKHYHRLLWHTSRTLYFFSNSLHRETSKHWTDMYFRIFRINFTFLGVLYWTDVKFLSIN